MVDKNICISFEDAMEIYKSTSWQMKHKLESIFPELKIKYPINSCEFLNNTIFTEGIGVTSNYNGCNTERRYTIPYEKGNEFAIFIELVVLMNEWNRIDKFTPDWSDFTQEKYCIFNDSDKIDTDVFWTDHKVLGFKTKETRDLFLYNFKELIIKCKNLI